MNSYTPKAQLMHKASTVSLVAHIIMLMLGTLVILPDGKQANPVVCAMLTLPLLAFLPFVVKRSIRAHAWLMFMTLFYFLRTVNVFDPNYGVLAQLEFANIILLFIFTMMFTRYEQRRLGISITR